MKIYLVEYDVILMQNFLIADINDWAVVEHLVPDRILKTLRESLKLM